MSPRRPPCGVARGRLITNKMKNKLFKITKYWFPVFLWMGFIFWLSSFHKLSVSEVSWQDFITRKLAHITEYAVLSGLTYRALGGTTRLITQHRLLVSIIIGILYSLTDEYHQTWISGRTGRWFDIGIDGVGVVIGGLVYRFGIINKLKSVVKSTIDNGR